MTYNIHHGRGTDGKQSLPRIAELVRNSGADIIGLNEVDRSFSRRSKFVDQVSWLSEQLNMHFIFGASVTRQFRDAVTGEYGNAILSRYPFVSWHHHLLKVGRSMMAEKRGLLEAEICLGTSGEGAIKILVTHLSLRGAIRRKQTEWIEKRISEESMPVVLMGDMNMLPGSGCWRTIAQRLDDVQQSVPGIPLCTFPSRSPRVRLDYIFASSSIRVKTAEVLFSHRAASDHLPLLASLSLTNAIRGDD